MKFGDLKMYGILADHPIKVTMASIGGAGASTIEMLTPPIQFAIAVVSLAIVCMTFVIKFRELIRGRKK